MLLRSTAVVALLLGLAASSATAALTFLPFIGIPFALYAIRFGSRALVPIGIILCVTAVFAAAVAGNVRDGIVIVLLLVVVPLGGALIIAACSDNGYFAKVPLIAISVFFSAVITGAVLVTVPGGKIQALPVEAEQRVLLRVDEMCEQQMKNPLIRSAEARDRAEENCEVYRSWGSEVSELGWALLIPALVLTSLLSSIFCISAWRWYARRRKLPVRPLHKLSAFTVHWFAAYVAAGGIFLLMASARVAGIPQEVVTGMAWSLIIWCALAYIVQGIATTIVLFRVRKTPMALRFAFWALSILMVFSVIPLITFAVIGLMEGVFRLRNRIRATIAPPDSDPS